MLRANRASRCSRRDAAPIAARTSTFKAAIHTLWHALCRSFPKHAGGSARHAVPRSDRCISRERSSHAMAARRCHPRKSLKPAKRLPMRHGKPMAAQPSLSGQPEARVDSHLQTPRRGFAQGDQRCQACGVDSRAASCQEAPWATAVAEPQHALLGAFCHGTATAIAHKHTHQEAFRKLRSRLTQSQLYRLYRHRRNAHVADGCIAELQQAIEWATCLRLGKNVRSFWVQVPPKGTSCVLVPAVSSATLSRVRPCWRARARGAKLSALLPFARRFSTVGRSGLMTLEAIASC